MTVRVTSINMDSDDVRGWFDLVSVYFKPEIGDISKTASANATAANKQSSFDAEFLSIMKERSVDFLGRFRTMFGYTSPEFIDAQEKYTRFMSAVGIRASGKRGSVKNGKDFVFVASVVIAVLLPALLYRTANAIRTTGDIFPFPKSDEEKNFERGLGGNIISVLVPSELGYWGQSDFIKNLDVIQLPLLLVLCSIFVPLTVYIWSEQTNVFFFLSFSFINSLFVFY